MNIAVAVATVIMTWVDSIGFPFASSSATGARDHRGQHKSAEQPAMHGTGATKRRHQGLARCEPLSTPASEIASVAKHRVNQGCEKLDAGTIDVGPTTSDKRPSSRLRFRQPSFMLFDIVLSMRANNSRVQPRRAIRFVKVR